MRLTNPKSTPWIERGYPPKPITIKAHTSKITGIVTAADAGEISAARRAGFFVIDADLVLRDANGLPMRFPKRPEWPLEPNQVIHPTQRLPLVGDYDLLGVIDPAAPGRNLTLAASQGNWLLDWNNPRTRAISEQLNANGPAPRDARARPTAASPCPTRSPTPTKARSSSSTTAPRPVSTTPARSARFTTRSAVAPSALQEAAGVSTARPGFGTTERVIWTVMITNVEISNYRSIGDRVSLKLGKLTALVGSNGSGKSNVVDALRFVSEALRNGLDAAITKRNGINAIRHWNSGRGGNISIGLQIVHDESEEGSYFLELSAGKDGDYHVSRETGSWNVYRATDACARILDQEWSYAFDYRTASWSTATPKATRSHQKSMHIICFLINM